jgi:hypothetical protein
LHTILHKKHEFGAKRQHQHDAPLAQNGHLNRFARVCRFFVTTGAFFARLPIVDDDVDVDACTVE